MQQLLRGHGLDPLQVGMRYQMQDAAAAKPCLPPIVGCRHNHCFAAHGCCPLQCRDHSTLHQEQCQRQFDLVGRGGESAVLRALEMLECWQQRQQCTAVASCDRLCMACAQVVPDPPIIGDISIAGPKLNLFLTPPVYQGFSRTSLPLDACTQA